MFDAGAAADDRLSECDGGGDSDQRGGRVPHRVDTADEVAGVLANRARTGGVLVAAPVPVADELSGIDEVLSTALADCEAHHITGAAVTPFVLGRIADATEGRSIPANLALAEHNAAVAAEIAVAASDRATSATKPA